jgi:DNA-binding Xre family transcriptional regulator
MFLNYCILNIFDYICAQNAQCWARIIKSDMEIQRYNRLKAAIERVQSEVCFNFTEREQARPQVKIVLAEKERTGTWLSDQMGHSISTVSRWMTNKVQPSVEQLYEIARHLDVDVKELLVSSK